MKPYFGHLFTQSSAYHREISYAESMLKQNLVEGYARNEYNPTKLLGEVNILEKSLVDLNTRNKFAEDITRLIKEGTGPFIFQIFQTTWGLALMDYIQYLGVPVFIDIDDDVFSINHDNSMARAFSDPDSDKLKIVKNTLENADGIIASTEYLADIVKKYTYEDRVHVANNGIDFDIYDKLQNNTHKTYTHIGWQGGSGHDTDLEIIDEAVRIVCNKHKNVRFTFVGDASSLSDKTKKIDRVKIDRTWTPIDKFPAKIAKLGFDIQLAPLADNKFNRSKSNLRLLQAGALHTPCVASNNGPYKGFPCKHAKTTNEWVAAIEKLIADVDARNKLGDKSYKHTKKHYNIDNLARKYANTLSKLTKKFKERS